MKQNTSLRNGSSTQPSWTVRISPVHAECAEDIMDAYQDGKDTAPLDRMVRIGFLYIMVDQSSRPASTLDEYMVFREERSKQPRPKGRSF
jgi:hypothetical protein